jgi:hypothetical protein
MFGLPHHSSGIATGRRQWAVAGVLLTGLLFSGHASAQGMQISCNPSDPNVNAYCLSQLEAAYPGVADGPSCWANTTCTAPNGAGGWYCNFFAVNRCYGSTYCCDPGDNSTCTPGNALGCGQGCKAGFANCHGSDWSFGCDTSVLTDVNNCGGCGIGCSVANGNPGCTTGKCKVNGCNAGYADCNNTYSDGCEVNTTSDASNCGGCGFVCSRPAGALNMGCAASSCYIASCVTGAADCNGIESDGCEVSLSTDPRHCGKCSTVCGAYANQTATCTAGACGRSCNTGYGNCDGIATNGCETNLQTDINNCGTCGNVCPAGTGSQRAVCNSGTCGFTTCPTGFATCGASGTCLDNVTTDVNNCGACGQQCSSANVAPACTGGMCTGACTAGFADCNGNKLTDGCEVNVQTDVNNCGGCGVACDPPHSVPLCSTGTCDYSACAAGYSDCDGNRANGCETLGSCPDMIPPPAVDMAVASDMTASPPPPAADMGTTGAGHSGCGSCDVSGSAPSGPAVFLLLLLVARLWRRRSAAVNAKD